jgi:hypothetical protein
MGALMSRITIIPASTSEGLAVKARIARHACNHFYEKTDDDADWDHVMARSLFDDVLRLASLLRISRACRD